MNPQARTTHTIPFRINLISMPWALFNRPSIQLGVLKAYLEKSSRGFSVAASHPYLETAAILGPELYHWISRNPWVSEAVYSPLVFPEQAGAAQELALIHAGKAEPEIRRAFDYKSVVARVEEQLLDWVERCNWEQYSLVGFSVCFHQLLASLAAARAVKDRNPEAAIVFGGSSCAAAAGPSLLNAFPFIDYIIQGEGEKSLLALCGSLAGKQDVSLPGTVIKRQPGPDQVPGPAAPAGDEQLASLADLPVPDYDDYISEQRKWFGETPFIPVLPVEFSRGCWWNRCSFCNLNLQWCGYRYKKAAQMLQEVKSLAAGHRCLDFTFVDNMLPPREALHFFKAAGEQRCDFNFFAEIRSTKSAKPAGEIFSIYRRGGLSVIQVGIEALSDSLLQKMRKGVSVIENIATMRSALENRLKLEGNLILQFPGSSQAEVDETLEALDYVLPYPPLTAASFFLGHDSPVYREPEKFGLKSIVDHPDNYRLFPRSVLSELHLLVKDYRGDKTHQRRLWQPVLQKVRAWRQLHARRRQSVLEKPLLSYRDCENFLLLRQELPGGEILHHRLQDTSRQIYLFCTRIRTGEEISARFSPVPSEKIFSFLADLEKKRLLFGRQNKYLALAVHFRD